MDMVTLYVIVLRLLHILSGVFWVGAAWMLAGFVSPTASASGPEGTKFMQRLMGGRLPTLISAAAGINILAGFLLYWRYTNWRLDLITTGAGLGFTLGALAALAAFGVGVGMSKPAADRLGALGKEIAASGKPPSPEQATTIQQLAKRVSDAAAWVAILLAVALIAMSAARYL